MSLAQLHWQWIEKGKTIKTEMVAQREIRSHEDMAKFVEDTKKDYPLPAGAIWMACNEESRYFVKTVNMVVRMDTEMPNEC